MNKKELIKKLNDLANEETTSDNLRDAENWHIEADEALVEYIDDKNIESAYYKIGKWYA